MKGSKGKINNITGVAIRYFQLRISIIKNNIAIIPKNIAQKYKLLLISTTPKNKIRIRISPKPQWRGFFNAFICRGKNCNTSTKTRFLNTS